MGRKITPLSLRKTEDLIASAAPDRRAAIDFRRHLVARAPLFRGLAVEVCDQLAGLARDRRVARREGFFEQGDPAEDVFVLCSGRLKMTQFETSGDQVILRLTGPGEVFGAVDVEPGGTYATSAAALEASYALVWDRGAIEAFAEQHAVLRRNTLRILAERMRGLEQRCRELTTERVPCRVARTLLRLVGQVGQPFEDGTLIGLTREELAQLTGTTLFSVSRLLGEWETRRLVRPRREAVVITDAPGLAAVAEGNAGRGDGVAAQRAPDPPQRPLLGRIAATLLQVKDGSPVAL